jgi:hypothetical protein
MDEMIFLALLRIARLTLVFNLAATRLDNFLVSTQLGQPIAPLRV